MASIITRHKKPRFILVAGGRQPLGAGQAGVGGRKLDGRLGGHGQRQLFGGRGRADPPQRPGGGRSHRGVLVVHEVGQQFHGLSILALADRIQHADQLPAVQLRGRVAQRLVDRRIGNAFQPEAGVFVELFVGQQGGQGGNGVFRAHHGQPLARLRLLEHRGLGILENLNQLGRLLRHDFLGVALGAGNGRRDGKSKHGCKQSESTW